MPVSRLLR
jgi:hypothetical protein